MNEAPLRQPDSTHLRQVDPMLTTSLVGRSREIAAMQSLLARDEGGLLTLTGPGGIGKTRLALRLAEDTELLFPGGVRFISLAAVSNPALVMPAIARAFDLRDAGQNSAFEQLAGRIRDDRVLIVLDNLEQVISTAPDVAAMLDHCPRLKLLVTSRTALRVLGEQEFPVPALEVSDTSKGVSLAALQEVEAINLFVQRSRAVRPDFALTEENAWAVSELCRRLDGLPLAIELAAARIKVLSPQALLDRLDERLYLLTGGPRDVPARLQTMRAAIDWSYELLPPGLQRFFRRLSIFSGGFDLETAELVAWPPLPGNDALAASGDDQFADALAAIEALVDHSLVRDVGSPNAGSRFAFLETIREYGLERLAASGEFEEMSRRHALWCDQFTNESNPHLWGKDGKEWLERLAVEHDNIRAALAWSTSSDREEDRAIANRIGHQVWWFWRVRSLVSEARYWFERALYGAPTSNLFDRAALLHAAGDLAWLQGDLQRAHELADEGLAVAEQSGEPILLGQAHYLLGIVTNDLEDAKSHTEQARTYFLQESWMRRWVVLPTITLGVLALNAGDFSAAHRHLNDALERSQETDFPWAAALTNSCLGELARAEGDYQRAIKLGQESLQLWWDHEDRLNAAAELAGLAEAALSLEHHDRAIRFAAAADQLRERHGAKSLPGPAATLPAHIEQLRAVTTANRFNEHWNAGKALSFDQWLTEATSLLAEPPNVRNPTPAARTLAPLEGLTPRENDVLRLLVAGLSTDAIATELHISPRTVKVHIARILEKFGVSSRAAAVTRAYQSGLV
jgi:predicted ATPase/DNA-binding CsgD family transcriptional regulator